MFLLKFSYEGKKYLLHNSESFIGGSSKWIAETRRLENSSKVRDVGGMDIVEMSEEELRKAVVIPYGIIAFTGGQTPFYAVEIKAEFVTQTELDYQEEIT